MLDEWACTVCAISDKVKRLHMIVDCDVLLKDQLPRNAIAEIISFSLKDDHEEEHVEYSDPDLNGFDIHTCRIYVQIRLSHFSWNARQ
jgi:hypothetical protein